MYIKTKKVQVRTIAEGDVLYWEHNGKKKRFSVTCTISRIREIDKTTITMDFAEGGFGVYGKKDFVNKVVH